MSSVLHILRVIGIGCVIASQRRMLRDVNKKQLLDQLV